jgi:hypothetical protein
VCTTDQGVCQIEQTPDLASGQTVVDILSITPSGHDAGFAKGHQVLGDGGLAGLKGGRHVADTCLVFLEKTEHSQPSGVSQALQKSGLGGECRHCASRLHIQSCEYD